MRVVSEIAVRLALPFGVRYTFAVGVLALLGAGCAPWPPAAPRTARDSVIIGVPIHPPSDRIADGSVVLQGSASYDTVTVGEAALLSATTVEHRAAAERAVASGMYLSDPFRVLRMNPTPGNPAVAGSPLSLPVGTPISAELLVRLDGAGPAPTLRFDHAPEVPFEDGPGGRRGPSAVGMELLPSADGAGYDRARLLLGDGRSWSEQPEVALPARDWRGLAHLVGIAIETDRVSLVLDGNAVLEEETYLRGNEGVPRLTALATVPGGAGILLLRWTSTAEPEGDDAREEREEREEHRRHEEEEERERQDERGDGDE